MKKHIITALFLILTVILFAGCGKSKADENGFFQEITPAMEHASKNNKNILVVVTMSGDDLFSKDFIEQVMMTDDFKKEVMSEYAVVHMDFSQTSYEKTIVNEDSSKEVQKASEEYAELMQRNSQLASMLNIQTTPSFVLMTKEKYYITALDPMEDALDYKTFKEILDSKKSVVENINSMVADIKKSSKMDKISAIDNLFEATDVIYRTFLSELINEVVSIDKNNESGLLSKYLIAVADVKASECYMTGDVNGAANAYLEVAENTNLLPEHQQQAYYLGAYIMAMSGSTEYDTILGYLNKSIAANPDSEDAAAIQGVLTYLSDAFASMPVAE